MYPSTVIGHRLSFPPDPLWARLSAIALTTLLMIPLAVISGLCAVGLFCYLCWLTWEGELLRAFLGSFGVVFLGLFSYGVTLLAWEDRAACFPCELTVDSEQQIAFYQYKTHVLKQISFARAQEFVCQYEVGTRGARYYTLYAMVGQQKIALHRLPDWNAQMASRIQQMSMAIASFTELPLHFRGAGNIAFKAEPGATYNRDMEKRRMAAESPLYITCRQCQQKVTAEEILAGAVAYSPSLRGAVRCPFPCCGETYPIQFSRNKFSVGKLQYANGKHQFQDRDYYQVPGLKVVWRPRELEISYKGKVFLLPPDA